MAAAARFFGALLGAILGLALAIAYNTSANVAALEGGHVHLTFKATLLAGAVGAGVGLVVTHFLLTPRSGPPRVGPPPTNPTGKPPTADDA